MRSLKRVRYMRKAVHDMRVGPQSIGLLSNHVLDRYKRARSVIFYVFLLEHSPEMILYRAFVFTLHP